MKRALFALLACTGCDALFGVDHLDTPDATDAPMCASRDEDCDGRVNAMDVCPADVDNSNDTDTDGVGDACDPDDGPEANHIAFFDGFDDNTGAWNIKSGPWQLGAGVFEQPTIADTRAERAVDAKFATVETIVMDFDTVANGSVTAFGSAAGSEVRCTVYRRESDRAEFLEIGVPLVPNKQVDLTGTGPLRIYGGQRQNGDFFCRARHGTNFDAEVVSANAGPATIDKIGIMTSSASATISSVTVYSVPLM